MALEVRELRPEETDVVVGYFHGAPPGQLDLMGIDPTRMPEPARWRRSLADDLRRPPERRDVYVLLWELDGEAVGFAGADRILPGAQAHMHLHVLDPARRRQGIGTAGVRLSSAVFMEALELARLYCEPNAFNVAPNRTLQRAGFRYLRTYVAEPGPMNFRQAVTAWVLERTPGQAA